MSMQNHFFRLAAVLLCLWASVACTSSGGNSEGLEPYYLGGESGRGIYTTANGSAEVTYHTLEINGVTYAIYDGDIILGTLPNSSSATADGAAPEPSKADMLRAHFGSSSLLDASGQVTYFDTNLFPNDRRWISGVIPYEFSGTLENWTDFGGKALIEKAMKHIEDKTGVQFVPRDPNNVNHNDYLIIDSWGDYLFNKNILKSCNFYVPSGRIGGGQTVVFTWGGCGLKQMIHDLTHIIGLQHEHLRADRDNYIEIRRENVLDYLDATDLFDTLPDGMFENMGSYDFNSVMQWDIFAYTKYYDAEKREGLPTIVPRPEYWDYLQTMGESTYLSPGDINSINSLWSVMEFLPQHLYLATNGTIQDYAMTTVDVPQIFVWFNQNRVMFVAQQGYDRFSSAVPITAWLKVDGTCVDFTYLPPMPLPQELLMALKGYKPNGTAFYADLAPTMNNPVPVYQYSNVVKGDNIPSTNPNDAQFINQGYSRSPAPIYYVHAEG